MLPKNAWCVGRNYAEHAKELGNEIPSRPLFFLKSGGACFHLGKQFGSVFSGAEKNTNIQWPHWAQNVHHEIEMILQFNENKEFSHIGLGLDLTERTLQNDLKKQGHPWTLAKSFQRSAPLSALVALDSLKIGDFSTWWSQLKIELYLDSQLVQTGHTQDMIFNPFLLKDFVLEHFPVEKDDLLFTGTPSGVGAMKIGSQGRALLTWQRDSQSQVIIDWSFHV